MSYTGYIVGFIVMAILIVAILAFGILHMAGLFLPEHHDEHAGATDDASADEHDDSHPHRAA